MNLDIFSKNAYNHVIRSKGRYRMYTPNISFSTELIAQIVHCIEDAVGDDIRADVRQHNLQTTNSNPSRIWDFLNTNVIKALDTEDCTIAKTHRGPWGNVGRIREIDAVYPYLYA